MAYAENTTVAVEKSIAEMVRLVKKAGAERVAQYEEPGAVTIQFQLEDRMVRFRVRFPTPEELKGARGFRSATNMEAIASADKRHRQRARALLLVIKAKLESVESGVETFEQAFLPNIVLADGATVYDRVAEPIAAEYQLGAPQQLLLSGPSER